MAAIEAVLSPLVSIAIRAFLLYLVMLFGYVVGEARPDERLSKWQLFGYAAFAALLLWGRHQETTNRREEFVATCVAEDFTGGRSRDVERAVRSCFAAEREYDYGDDDQDHSP